MERQDRSGLRFKSSGTFQAQKSDRLTDRPPMDEQPMSPTRTAPFKSRDTARNIRAIAADETNLVESIPQMISGMKDESDSLTRTYYAEAAMRSIKSGRFTIRLLPSLAELIESPDINLRYPAIMALGYHAESGNDLSERYLELLRKSLKDISPRNREAAIRAMKSFSSQSETNATRVLDTIGDEFIKAREKEEKGTELNPFEEAVREVGEACLKVCQDDIAKTLALLTGDYHRSVAAFANLKDRAERSKADAADILGKLNALPDKTSTIVCELKAVCNRAISKP